MQNPQAAELGDPGVSMIDGSANMNAGGSSAKFDALALIDQLPLEWHPTDLDDPTVLEHVNDDAARALQAHAVFEEQPRSPHEDQAHTSHELIRLESKLDLILSLMGKLLSNRVNLPASHSVIFRATRLEWSGSSEPVIRRGDTGIIDIYANPQVPLPVRLPGRIASIDERNGNTWLLVRFEKLSPVVSEGLEKLIFRHHRRQIAIARATIVTSNLNSG